MFWEEPLAFLISLFVFAVFALMFFFYRKRDDNFLTAFLVCSITTISSILLLGGLVMGTSEFGIPVYFTRWLFYIASCTLLMITISRLLRAPKKSFLPIIVLNGLVMFSGAMAALMSSPYKWIIFLAGVFFFVAQLVLLFEKAPKSAKANMVRNYITFGWALFPVVFVLAPEGLGLINNMFAAILYLVLDFATKIAFYLHLASMTRRRKVIGTRRVEEKSGK